MEEGDDGNKSGHLYTSEDMINGYKAGKSRRRKMFKDKENMLSKESTRSLPTKILPSRLVNTHEAPFAGVSQRICKQMFNTEMQQTVIPSPLSNITNNGSTTEYSGIRKTKVGILADTQVRQFISQTPHSLMTNVQSSMEYNLHDSENKPKLSAQVSEILRQKKYYTPTTQFATAGNPCKGQINDIFGNLCMPGIATPQFPAVVNPCPGQRNGIFGNLCMPGMHHSILQSPVSNITNPNGTVIFNTNDSKASAQPKCKNITGRQWGTNNITKQKILHNPVLLESKKSSKKGKGKLSSGGPVRTLFEDDETVEEHDDQIGIATPHLPADVNPGRGQRNVIFGNICPPGNHHSILQSPLSNITNNNRTVISNTNDSKSSAQPRCKKLTGTKWGKENKIDYLSRINGSNSITKLKKIEIPFLVESKGFYKKRQGKVSCEGPVRTLFQDDETVEEHDDQIENSLIREFIRTDDDVDSDSDYCYDEYGSSSSCDEDMAYELFSDDEKTKDLSNTSCVKSFKVKRRMQVLIPEEYATLGAPTFRCSKCNAQMWREERVNKNVTKGTPIIIIIASCRVGIWND